MLARLCVSSVLAAGPMLVPLQSSPQPTQTFRITSELVQLDALFLGERGHPVPDIRKEEVSLRQQGVAVARVDLRYQPRRSVVAADGLGAGDPLALASADATESWVSLIDDLAMSPDGFARAQSGLQAMLQQELPPGIEFGVLRTGELGHRTTPLSGDRAGTAGKDRVCLEGTLGSLYFGRSNEIAALLARLVVAEQGHYLMTHAPPDGTFDDRGKARFVPVTVSVSRPNVTVRTRSGFFTR